jgi:hypothetical protein
MSGPRNPDGTNAEIPFIAGLIPTYGTKKTNRSHCTSPFAAGLAEDPQTNGSLIELLV